MNSKAKNPGLRVYTLAAGLAFAGLLVAPHCFAAESQQSVAATVTTGSETTSTGSATNATSDDNPLTMPEPELPNVDDILSKDGGPQSGKEASSGLSGAVRTDATAGETAMVAPRTTVPTAAKTTPPGKALPPMTQVKVFYKQGKYFDALKTLAQIKPNELTHYYAGLCYQGQGQLQKAAAEFGYVASIAKDPMVKYNAQSALSAVSSYASRRTYSGQGNAFARAPMNSGGGGGGGTRRS